MNRMFAIGLVVVLGACGQSPDPETDVFASHSTDRWEVERHIREVAPALSWIQERLVARSTLGGPYTALLKKGAPSLFSVLKRIRRFEFHVEKAVLDTEGGRLDVLVSYEALLSGDSIEALEGLAHQVWEREASGDWVLKDWTARSERLVSAPSFRFREVLGQRVDAKSAGFLRRSLHEEKVSSVLQGGVRPQHPLEFESFDRHPGVSIVDVDGNGWDDIYVMARWGKNQLLLNNQGRFTEAGEEWGLDLENYSTSAVFADFDNDGDPDLVVGRSLEESALLENEKGRFQPPSLGSVPKLPRLVSSVSVVDFDGDGWLDIYFSTYAASLIEQVREAYDDQPELAVQALSSFLGEDEAAELVEKVLSEDFHFYLQRPGPRNVLWKNEGGLSFREVALPDTLSVPLNTYQASWSDIDLDGDADLYLANDFAHNHLFRNDGEAGFTDITQETGTEDFGFGMGVGWGDYDRDGRFDLYVSNMYSRAGRRMTEGLENSDPRISKAARGNSLFRNGPNGFERVSGLEKGLLVEKAGWAWGGQFLDVNNDGWQDLYVPNGYYSAPDEVAVEHDT